MNEIVFPPVLIMLVAAALIPLLPVSLRLLPLIIGPLASLWMIWGLGDGLLYTGQFLGYEVAYVQADNLRRLFATAFALMALFAGLFSYSHAGLARKSVPGSSGHSQTVELSAAMAYGAGAVGVSFAGDLVALFLYWQVMMLFSTVMIWSACTDASRGAGIRYAILQLIAGLLFKAGIEALTFQTGSSEIRVLALEGFGAWMILSAILISAAAPPLSAWMSDIYPKASPTGSVFLSLYTSKTAVLMLMLLFAGAQLLVWLGLFMIFYGIFYAVNENNLRRLLCYAMVNQIGFMLCGIGAGSEDALNAVAIFAIVHVIGTGVLFMTAANVIRKTGSAECTALGSLYHSMPLSAASAISIAVAFTLLPFASGLVAAVDASQGIFVWLLLLLGCSGVFLHAGLKYVWLVFLNHSAEPRGEEPAALARLAMIVPALLALALVLAPGLLGSFLPYETGFTHSTAANLLSLLAVLLVASVIFYLFRPLMLRSESIRLDSDRVYRQWLPGLWRNFEALLASLNDYLQGFVNGPLRKLPQSWLNYHGPEGPLARTWPTGSMLLWVTVILAVLLIGARLL